MASGLHSWSKTAASNATADSAVNWQEGQAPSSVNDSARAMMSSAAQWRDDTNASITTGGTSTAYSVTSNQGFATLTAMGNAVIAFVPHTTSGDAPTLSVDGLTAKKLRFVTGKDLPAGALIEGTPYVFTYFASVGEFIAHGLGTFDHYVPIAAGFEYWGTTAPNSSLAFSYGQAISRTVYATAFARMGTTYGVGDGSTTFNLPDKRGRVSFGKDNMGGSAASRVTAGGSGIDGQTLGNTGGAETVTIAQSNLPNVNFLGSTSGNLTFTIQYNLDTGFLYQASGNQTAVSNVAQSGFGTTVAAIGSLQASVSSGGGGVALNKMPPCIIANYLIRVL